MKNVIDESETLKDFGLHLIELRKSNNVAEINKILLSLINDSWDVGRLRTVMIWTKNMNIPETTQLRERVWAKMEGIMGHKCY